jgi:protease PrsW
MDVYISSQGSQKGPYSLEQIRQMQERHEILPTDYAWYAGLPAWVPVSQLQPDGSVGPPPTHQKASFVRGAASAFGRVAGGITSIAGVERIEGLYRKDFFSDVFKKKSDDEIEALFTTGTKTTTPALETIDTRWPHPWLFIRMAIAAGLLYLGFYIGAVQLHQRNFLPGMILVGSFAIPLATLVFFVEMNVPRNVSLYQVFKLVNAGGLIALITTIFLGQWLASQGLKSSAGETVPGAMLTGLTEETAKMAAVILLMRNKRFTWTLNGLLIGAAVGAGFAAFESAGYAVFNLLQWLFVGAVQPVVDLVREVIRVLAAGHDVAEGDVQKLVFQTISGQYDSAVEWMRHVMRLRAALAPLGHIVWTGLAAAALWKVKGDQRFRMTMLIDWRFVRVFLLVVVLHGLWDSPPLISDWLVLHLRYPLLGFVAWVLVLAYVQDGLKQIRQAQEALPRVQPQPVST